MSASHRSALPRPTANRSCLARVACAPRSLLVLAVLALPTLLAADPDGKTNGHVMEKLVSPTETSPDGALVDLFSGGLSLDIPLYSASVSSDLGLQLRASYRSKGQWHFHDGGTGNAFWLPRDPYNTGRPEEGECTELGWGWRFTMGRIGFEGGPSQSKFLYTPDGQAHKLYQVGAAAAGTKSSDWDKRRLITRDGSRLLVTWFRNIESIPGSDNNNRFFNRIYQVRAPNGTIYEYGHWVGYANENECADDDNDIYLEPHHYGWYLTSVIDVHGNRIDVEYHEGVNKDHLIKQIVDTHGRTVTTTLTASPDPMMDGLMDSITYPAEDGSATIDFTYVKVTDLQRPPMPLGPSGGLPMSVAELQRITLPGGAVHEFEYNDHGELAVHALPTGSRLEYEFENYIVAGGAIVSGRGVVSRTVTVDPNAPLTPDNQYSWHYVRNQATCPGYPYVWRVHVRDPFDMWRSYHYVDATAGCFAGLAQPTSEPLVEHVYIWDRPFVAWPNIECGMPPPDAQVHVHVQNKWEGDPWPLQEPMSIAQDCLNDKEFRLIWTKTTHDDGSWQTVDRCGWDGLGHFAHEVVRASTTGANPLLATPRYVHTVHRPLACQWILDLPVLKEVAEGGWAATEEWAYSADGQAKQHVMRKDLSVYPPPGLPQGELDDYQCDNGGEDALRWTDDFNDPDAVENLLFDNDGYWPPLVDDGSHVVGPWKTVTNHVFCPGHAGPFRVQDLDGLGDPGVDPEPTGCVQDPELPLPPTSLLWTPGEVRTTKDYYGSVIEPGNTDDHPHPHACWGQLKKTTASGGDSSATFVKLHEWACGTAETERWVDPSSGAPLSWYSLDQDVQCDSVDAPGVGPNTGLVIKSRDTAGFGTVQEHDDLGRVVKLIPDVTIPPPPLGADEEAPTTITYSADMLRKSTIKRKALGLPGVDTESYETFDGLGRQVLVQNRKPNGWLATQSTSYDAYNRALRQSRWFDTGLPHDVQAGPDPTIFSYATTVLGQPWPEPLGRLVATEFADGAEAALAYSGKVTTETVAGINNDPAQIAVTTRYFDALNRLRRVDVPNEWLFTPAADADYVYDRRDRLVFAQLSLGLEIQQRSWTYDGLGRLRAASQPESGTTAMMKHDALGNLLSFVDADGRVHGREYDVAGRLTASGEGEGAGFVARDILAYDGPYAGYSGGKLTSTTTMNFGVPFPGSATRQYQYAGLSGRLSHTGFQNDLEVPSWFNSRLGYDEIGNMNEIEYPQAYPSPPLIVRYGYFHGRPVTAGTPTDPQEFVQSTVYHASGGIAQQLLGNGVFQQTTQDTRGRIQRITADAVGSVFDSGVYSHDGAGNLVGLGATATRGPDAFQYDLNGRLAAAGYSHVGTFSTVYDPFGNISDQFLSSAGSGCPTYELNEFHARQYRMGQGNVPIGTVTNRISELGVDPGCFAAPTVSYSNSGYVLHDETASYTYDIQERMTTRLDLATGAWRSFGYDANGWRTWVDKGLSTPATHYLRGPGGETWLERNVEGGGDKAYIYFGGRLVATRDYPLEGSPVDRWYTLDHLGSARAITLADGSVEGRYDYGPYGIELPRVSNGGQQTRMFAGHLREGDDSHDYMMARYFSVRHGRFLAVDPKPASAKTAHPSTWNRYAYALNAPLMLVDPDGKEVTILAAPNKAGGMNVQVRATFEINTNIKNDPAGGIVTRADVAALKQNLESTWTTSSGASKVRTTVDITRSAEGGTDASRHQIVVDSATLRQNYNIETRTMQLLPGDRSGATNVASHEFGHGLGLGDRYTDVPGAGSVAHSGFLGNLMAQTWALPARPIYETQIRDIPAGGDGP